MNTNPTAPHRASNLEPEHGHTPLFSWMEALERYSPWSPIEIAAGIALIAFFLANL